MQVQKAFLAFERGDETVFLSGKELGDGGGVKVAAMLAASTSVKTLRMHKCKLGVRATVALADAMMKNKCLVALDVGGEACRT